MMDFKHTGKILIVPIFLSYIFSRIMLHKIEFIDEIIYSIHSNPNYYLIMTFMVSILLILLYILFVKCSKSKFPYIMLCVFGYFIIFIFGFIIASIYEHCLGYNLHDDEEGLEVLFHFLAYDIILISLIAIFYDWKVSIDNRNKIL